MEEQMERTDPVVDEAGGLSRGPEGPDAEPSREGELAPEDGTSGAAEPEGTSADEAEELRGELEVLTDRHLRLAAEFENYRKRSRSELAQSGIRAQARLIASLLEALDDLEGVAALDPEATPAAAVLEGIELVERKLFQLLGEAGLQEVDASGASFDPNVMEAMTRAPADSEAEDDTVEQVFRKGFLFRGQLVRPARVSVRKFG